MQPTVSVRITCYCLNVISGIPFQNSTPARARANLEDFGRRVRRTSAERLARQTPAPHVRAHPGEPEIGQLDMSRVLQQHVITLDVPVSYLVAV